MEFRRIGIFPNLGKENVCLALPDFISLCMGWGLEPVLPDEVALMYETESYNLEDAASLQSLDVAVSLGGDGTLLQMARHIAPLGIPAFGINFGKLGFLAEVDAASIGKAIARLAQGNCSIENRSLLQAQVVTEGKVQITVHALNDLVLAKGMFSKLAHLSLHINGKPSGSYAADGIIVATATGSTAYSLSAGGPLVMPALDVSVITPVCAHSLTARALVIPMSESIELRAVPGSEEMMLSADGENVMVIADGTAVRVQKSPYVMKFIRLTGRDYYQTWQQKLMRNI